MGHHTNPWFSLVQAPARCPTWRKGPLYCGEGVGSEPRPKKTHDAHPSEEIDRRYDIEAHRDGVIVAHTLPRGAVHQTPIGVFNAHQNEPPGPRSGASRCAAPRPGASSVPSIGRATPSESGRPGGGPRRRWRSTSRSTCWSRRRSAQGPADAPHGSRDTPSPRPARSMGLRACSSLEPAGPDHTQAQPSPPPLNPPRKATHRATFRVRFSFSIRPVATPRTSIWCSRGLRAVHHAPGHAGDARAVRGEHGGEAHRPSVSNRPAAAAADRPEAQRGRGLVTRALGGHGVHGGARGGVARRDGEHRRCSEAGPLVW